MGKVRTTYRGGSRFYIHPDDAAVTHPGVTSIIDMLGKHNILGPWNAKMTAELAADSLDVIQRMLDTAGRDAVVDYLKGAARRYTKARSDLGSDAHDLFERMIRGEEVRSTRVDLSPYAHNFREFLDAINPELVRAEDVAWSDTYGYAGSFDAMLRVWFLEDGTPDPTRSADSRPLLLMSDWKTGKNTYPDVALQMSAYANADYIIDAEGTRHEMPEFDGAAVLHITGDSWAFKPVAIDEIVIDGETHNVFEYFLHLRAMFDWARDVSRNVIGKPIARKAGLVTGTQRRGK